MASAKKRLGVELMFNIVLVISCKARFFFQLHHIVVVSYEWRIIFYSKIFTKILEVFIFKFSIMIIPKNYTWQTFFILNMFHEFRKDSKSLILVVQESNPCRYSIIINNYQTIPFATNRFSSCWSKVVQVYQLRCILVEISFLLLKELLTYLPLILTHKEDCFWMTWM